MKFFEIEMTCPKCNQSVTPTKIFGSASGRFQIESPCAKCEQVVVFTFEAIDHMKYCYEQETKLGLEHGGEHENYH